MNRYGYGKAAPKPAVHSVPRGIYRDGLRDIARKLWENKRDHGLNPYLAVHVKGPSVAHPGGMIYEGAKTDGWQTAFEDGKDVEYFCCGHNALCTDGKDHHFYLKLKVDEIVFIQVLN